MVPALRRRARMDGMGADALLQARLFSVWVTDLSIGCRTVI